MKSGTAISLLWLCAWLVACGTGEVSRPTNSTANPEVDARLTDSESVPPPSRYNTREGETVFLHYCAPCHGDGGGGDGFNAYNLTPKPRNLADPEFQDSHTDEDLATTIRVGGRAAGLSSQMPPWGRTLNDRQIHNVVLYVRTLSPEAGEE